MPLKHVFVGGGGAYATSQTTLLHMKRLDKTRYPIVFFSVFFIPKGNRLDFYFVQATDYYWFIIYILTHFCKFSTAHYFFFFFFFFLSSNDPYMTLSDSSLSKIVKTRHGRIGYASCNHVIIFRLWHKPCTRSWQVHMYGSTTDDVLLSYSKQPLKALPVQAEKIIRIIRKKTFWTFQYGTTFVWNEPGMLYFLESVTYMYIVQLLTSPAVPGYTLPFQTV